MRNEEERMLPSKTKKNALKRILADIKKYFHTEKNY